MNRFEIKREQSTKQIMDAAIRLFAENGYEKTSIRMIAQEATISLGLLYNYYNSKENVLKDIMHFGIKDFQASLRPVENLQAEITISQLIGLMLKHVKQNQLFWKIWYQTRGHNPVYPEMKKEMQTIDSWLQKKIEENLVFTSVPFPGLETKLLLATLDGLIQHYLLSDNFPLDDVANLLLLKYK